jgi:hypothetical protein
LLTSLRYFRSGSFSNKRVSAEASNLKSLEKYKEKSTIVEIKIIISFGNDSNFLYIEN